MHVTPEEALVSIMKKCQQILNNHSMEASIVYISVPTYISEEERAAIRTCTEVAFQKGARLVDEWASLACQYAYAKLK